MQKPIKKEFVSRKIQSPHFADKFAVLISQRDEFYASAGLQELHPAEKLAKLRSAHPEILSRAAELLFPLITNCCELLPIFHKYSDQVRAELLSDSLSGKSVKGSEGHYGLAYWFSAYDKSQGDIEGLIMRSAKNHALDIAYAIERRERYNVEFARHYELKALCPEGSREEYFQSSLHNHPAPTKAIMLTEENGLAMRWAEKLLSQTSDPGRNMAIFKAITFDDKTYAEVGEEFQLPIGTVKAIMHRLYGKLSQVPALQDYAENLAGSRSGHSR